MISDVDSPSTHSSSSDWYSDVPDTPFSCDDDTVVDETQFPDGEKCPKSPDLKAERHRSFMKEYCHWNSWANGVDVDGKPFYSDTEANYLVGSIVLF